MSTILYLSLEVATYVLAKFLNDGQDCEIKSMPLVITCQCAQNSAGPFRFGYIFVVARLLDRMIGGFG